jgi:tRNA pseudouridine55 synthase
VDLAPVTVTVHEWQILDREGSTWRVTISCDSGTYVRALARDLGRLAGSLAHLSQLRRLSAGPFTVNEAVDLRTLELNPQSRPALEAVPQLPRQELGLESLRDVRHGRAVPATVEGERGALVAPDGTLAAIAQRREGNWQPTVVLAHD